MSDEAGKTLYMSMAVKKSLTLNIMGVDQELPLDYEEGMIGMAPVFETYEEAKKAYPGHSVMAVEVLKTEE